MSVAPNPAPSRHLFGDLTGGFAAMLVALPSAIAYGVAVYSPIGAEGVAAGVRAGILGAVALGLVAAIISGSPRLISVPCAPAAAVLAALVTQQLQASGSVSVSHVAAVLILVALATGLLQLGYGFARGGKLIKFIPFPVVSGYLSAVGVIIFVGQLPKFLGATGHASLGSILAAPAGWQWPAILIGVATIVAMILSRRFLKAVPAPIVGVLAGVAAYGVLAVYRPELRHVTGNALVLGPLAVDPSDLFSGLAAPWRTIGGLSAAELNTLLAPTLTLSVLLSIDTLKTCVVVDALTRGRHDSNRTLIAQGAANVTSALIGGMPGAGMMGATLVNSESGGRTRFSGIAQGTFSLIAALILGRALAWVPVAALAGMLMVVGVRMIDWHSVQLLRQRATALDFAVIATVIIVAVASNLIAAAGAGVGFAIILFLRDQVRSSVVRRKLTGDMLSSKMHRLHDEQLVLEKQGVLTTVCELQGNLFFGTTEQLRNELEPDLARCRYLVLDLRRVQSVDFTAAHVFEQIEAQLAERQGYLLFSRVPARYALQAYFAPFLAAHPRVKKYETLDDALQWVEDQILAEAMPARVTNHVHALGLGEFELTREFEADHMLDALAACVDQRTVAAGETVCRRGEPASELYLIRRGIVRIALPLKDGSYHNLAFYGRGHFFGEMSFLARATRSADAVATTDTELFVISRARFDTASRAQPLVGLKIYARLAYALAWRLRKTDEELRALYEA